MLVEAISLPTLERARQHLTECYLCEHRCGVNRANGEQGPCKAGVTANVFRHRVECGEESELIPSHLFYLSGCDLRCKFCIAEENAFNPRLGTELTANFFREALDWGRTRHAINVQWVGGEPTIHLPAILNVMAAVDELPSIVWKSDFYGTPESLDLLTGVVDIYVADFKFGNNDCAERLASVPRYVEVITRNLLHASMQADLIVRHLLLPGHFDCCFRPIIDWMARRLPLAKFSLRDGYRPRWLATRDSELSRSLTAAEIGRAERLARDAGINLIH
ncbi:MAG: radical SAM protein [Pirellulales bacterium]